MRQPGPCVRALCEPVALFLSMIIDHDTQRLTLQCNTKRHLAVSRSHFTLHTALFTLRHPSQHKSHATFMQPVQCDLQPHVAEHHRGTNHRSKRPKPQPHHTGAALHRRLQPLYTKKHNVSRSGILPNTSPCFVMYRVMYVLLLLFQSHKCICPQLGRLLPNFL